MFGEKITITCLFCNKDFITGKSYAEKHNRRFCDQICSARYRSVEAADQRPFWTCEQCGKSFKRKYERKYPPRFCSQKCHGQFKTGGMRAGAGPLIEKPCLVCGKQMQTRVGSRLYCSRECPLSRKRGARHQEKPCDQCKKVFKPRHGNNRFCSRECLYLGSSGEKNPGWKGGRHVTGEGYVKLYLKDHPTADSMGYVSEHRFLMERILGRPLKHGENVHHINGNRSDNREENLELWIKKQPQGQRAKDIVKWAREIIREYGDLFPEGS